MTDAPCACGRTHVRILRVTGRTDDMLIVRGVNVYPSQLEAILVGLPGLTPHYQIVLTREGALDCMTVEIEAAPAIWRRARPARKAAEVCHHIKSMIGVTCEVAVKAPGEMPRSQGKAVRVRDHAASRRGEGAARDRNSTPDRTARPAATGDPDPETPAAGALIGRG